MLNIVYAFDENYNKQGFVSICSVLEKVSSECNIFIVHQNKKTFNKFKKQIEYFFPRCNIELFDFVSKSFSFPNLENVHVSEATFYRLFFDEYIPTNIKNLIYLDADVVCLKDPTNLINDVFNNMSEKKYLIGAKTEHTINDDEFSRISKLGVEENYFNAGVLFIKYQKLTEKNIFQQLQAKLIEISDIIKYWDQDVLNSYFNGEYFELTENLNFNSEKIDNKNIDCLEDIFFLHYQGSNKPWTVEGAFSKSSDSYNIIYRKYGLGNYHITTKWKKDLLVKFIFSLITFKIIRLEYPISYLRSVIECLLNKD